MKINPRWWRVVPILLCVGYLGYSIYENNVEITKLTQERDELIVSCSDTKQSNMELRWQADSLWRILHPLELDCFLSSAQEVTDTLSAALKKEAPMYNFRVYDSILTPQQVRDQYQVELKQEAGE